MYRVRPLIGLRNAEAVSIAAILQVVSIIEDCWKEAAQRPSMKQIFERLKVIVEGLKAQESGHKSALR